MAKPDLDWNAVAMRVSSIFTPSAPINSEDLFRGRTAQVREVVDAINQPGRHAILFGGRGVGKTSLGKILPKKLQAMEPCPIFSPFVTCDSTDNYGSIWRKVFLEIRYLTNEPPPGVDEPDPVEDLNTPWTPYEVRRRLEPYSREGLLYVVIDEFDKVTDEYSRQLMADTIKLLSDHAVEATLVIIGVADDVADLISDHQSIDRCLAQIPMPRMPRSESESIVTDGLRKLRMSIHDDALHEIVGLCKGLPTYVHVLALHAARDALDKKELVVEAKNVKNAVERAISQAEETIHQEYDKATFSTRATIYPQVLLACAMCRTDEYGRFVPNDLCEPMRVITGVEYKSDRFTGHLKAFCTDDRGQVLRMTGMEYRWRYQFRNPLLQPYVLMRGLHTKMVSEDDLRLRPPGDT
jgi:hypothetical protein